MEKNYIVISLNGEQFIPNKKRMKILNNSETFGLSRGREYTYKDIEDGNIYAIDHWIGKLQARPDLYRKAAFLLTLALQGLVLSGINFNIPCSTFMTASLGLEGSFRTLLELFTEIAKYSFLVLGIKDAVIKTINGGSVKESIQASLQYAFAFLFLQLYPGIFDIFSGIKF